jgi:hypothetical protein
MTDRPEHDQAERIRRLQERRTVSTRTRTASTRTETHRAAPAVTTSSDAAAPVRAMKTPRRRHPAAAARWLLGGLSVASFFSIASTVAVANRANLNTPAAVTSATATPAAPTSATPAPSASTASRSTPAPAAHTVTRGS